MKTIALAALAVMLAGSANADFSYTVTQKTTGGSLAALAGAAGNRTSQYFLKGQKLKVDMGDIAVVLDFDAQTITTINSSRKTVSVKGFNDLAGTAPDAGVNMNIRETGQKKTVNGFSASELIMTMEIEMGGGGRGGPGLGKMQLEMDMWISPDPPGVGELRTFYAKNASRFPYSALAGSGANAGMQSAIAEMQKKLASMNGVQVEQIIRMRPAAGAAVGGGLPQLSGPQATQLAQARKQLEELAKAGGPAAAVAQQQLARMPGGAPPAGSSTPAGVVMEITLDSSNFSTSVVPDSVFQVPADYTKAN